MWCLLCFICFKTFIAIYIKPSVGLYLVMFFKYIFTAVSFIFRGNWLISSNMAWWQIIIQSWVICRPSHLFFLIMQPTWPLTCIKSWIPGSTWRQHFVTHNVVVLLLVLMQSPWWRQKKGGKSASNLVIHGSLTFLIIIN